MAPDDISAGTGPATLFAHLGGDVHEVAAIAYLDPEWRLLGMRHAIGHRMQVGVPIREIVRDALAFRAACVVVAHTHPSGDPRASVADLAFTRTLARTLDAIDIMLFDHLILAGDNHISLRVAGLL